MNHWQQRDGDLEMAEKSKSDDFSMKAFERELKRQMNEETRGMSKEDKEQYIREFFVKNMKRKKAKKTMTANKGGMAKTTKKMRGGGMAMGKAKMAKKKMRGGGMMKKKMMGGGMAKMSKKKKMMRGGMAKKKK